MKKILVASSLLSLLLSASAFAADAPASSSPAPVASPAALATRPVDSKPVDSKPVAQKPMTIRGAIVSIDTTAKTMVIKIGKKDETFALGDVKVMKSKKAIQVADLKPGARVSGSVLSKDGKEELQTLTVK